MIPIALVAPPAARVVATPRDHAIGVTATVAESPAAILLRWPAMAGSDGVTIYRKGAEDSDWGPPYASLAGGATGFEDTKVEVGIGYEYRIDSKQNGVAAYGYAYCGIHMPLVDRRGKVLLVVDATQAGPLAAELKRLESDLFGDGWSVVRRDVARQATVASAATAAEVAAVKGVIDRESAADPDALKGVLLLGRIACPYSGDIRPDGHDNHRGAWPADTYYTQVGVTWPDVQALSTNGRNANQPGDGKFDNSLFDPALVRFAVGRVDMSALPAFGVPETELLRRYLDKDHAFRHRQVAYRPRCVVSDTFGERAGQAYAQNGWRLATLVGPENMVAGSIFADTQSVPTLWSYACGPGSTEMLAGIGSTSNFVTGTPQAVFTMLFGSYNGDYDQRNDLLRACLASRGAGLTCTWAARPHWYWHHMALGEPIGDSVRRCQRNVNTYLPSLQNANRVHGGFLGDPTLRMHTLAPPSALSVRGGALSWSASGDAATPGFQGYHVYRAASPAGPFVRLTPSVVVGTAWTDPSPVSTAVYQVRAIRLETSTTGTYLNNSQGIFATGTTPAGTRQSPRAPGRQSPPG